MSIVALDRSATGPSLTRTQRLDRFLKAYWLRPENALWMALRSEVLAGLPWQGPSVDLSCGDGVFSFLHFGGRFDDDFDVFVGSAPLGPGGDEPVDAFDYVDGRYQPMIVRPAAVAVDVGTDWKPNLLTKAGCLGLYEELVVHDNNLPLPFGDAAFQTVYCNAIYWIENIDSFLAEMGRITAPGGRVLLEVKLDSVLRYTLERHRPILGGRFLDLIDRGRAATWPSMADRGTWEARFARAGLTVARALPFVTRTHAHLWDVGLRPIAPLLIELANGVNPDTRRDVKRRWVELFTELCTPLCDPQIDLLPGQNEPAEILYELRPG
ncbi:MAG: methyltransferase domain-containing protein [bacterium]|nr:methyltransferase domain-containing protein [bacterium]